jgi:hypothetical protein
MSKSRKYSGRSMSKTKKMLKKTTKSAVQGIKTVGSVAKNVVEKSAPMVEKGMSQVYGTLATGFDLGIQSAKNVARGVSKTIKKRHTNRKSRRYHN